MNEYLSDPEEAKDYLPRYKYIYALLVFTFVIFVMRLWYLQVFQGEELRLFSEKNRFKIKKIQAPRGMVVDREGKILVDNFPGFEVSITPQYASELEKTADSISSILNIPADRIVKLVKTEKRKNGPFRPVVIKNNLNRDEVARLDRLRINNPGLDISMTIQRTYLLKDNGAQLFGYVGEISKNELPKYNKNLRPDEKFEQGDIVGKNGLEVVYDKELRGLSGQDFIQVDARGREIKSLSVPELIGDVSLTREPVPGSTLMLTIDKDIQEAAHKAFVVDRERIGGVVALNPKNGEILAWVNGPSFDPTDFSKGISSKMWSDLINHPFKPLRNKVIQDHFPPGSTFKAIVALAALQEKEITKNSTVFCPGFYKFGRRVYHCHQKRGHGYVNVTQSLEQSCDVFFYKMGLALGIDKIAKYARSFGFGKRTGINMVNEVPGLVPTEEWKQKTFGEPWQPGENLSNAIGQGFFLTTALQLAQAFTSFANIGPVYQPHFIKKVLDINGKIVKELKPEIKFDPVAGINTEVTVSKENMELIKEGLWMVGNGAQGTAKWHKVANTEISGKTGTVQLFTLSADQVFADCKARPIKQRHHGWYVAYAPSKDPEIVVSVLAEHACSGSGGAAPVARDIIEAYMKKYHPEKFVNNAPKPKPQETPVDGNAD